MKSRGDAQNRIYPRKRTASRRMAREKRLERMDERTVSLRFGSVVPRINQLCLSVFHRAGGELISFSLNTNSFFLFFFFFLFSFFSRQKPISIKMARAFRILPDYKRLPSQLPLPPASFHPFLFEHAALLSSDRALRIQPPPSSLDPHPCYTFRSSFFLHFLSSSRFFV